MRIGFGSRIQDKKTISARAKPTLDSLQAKGPSDRFSNAPALVRLTNAESLGPARPSGTASSCVSGVSTTATSARNR